MPEAVSHPNWEHISLLFWKRNFERAEVFEIGDLGGVKGKVQQKYTTNRCAPYMYVSLRK